MKQITTLAILFFVSQILSAQQVQDKSDVTVITCSHFGISRPLRDLFEPEQSVPGNVVKEIQDRENRVPQTFLHSAAEGPEYSNDPSTIQKHMGSRATTPILKNWAGQIGVCPPDPTGAVGTDYYVQAVNATPLKIFNKTTGAQVGSVIQVGSLWTPAINDDGDPILLYDKYADRWLLSQLGTSFSGIYIAISTTNDPTGTYYTYTFNSPNTLDYPKYSIWADGYYMTFNGSTKRVFCFERDSMLIGSPNARAISKTFTSGPVSGFYAPLPADADGQLPPFGTPCPFVSYSENAWGTGAVDGVKIWTMSVNWALATPTATIAGPTVLATAAFDGTYNSNWNDISQPGTTQKLDGIGGVCIFRAQWRQWVGYNTMVLNWGVKLSSIQRSIKWVELRQDQSSGTWSLYQEGIYAPDSSSRWVGSIAMDDNGSIALCYAKSSSAAGNYPSLAFTGRLASDPLGQMTFAETVAMTGTGSQTGGCGNRFGDYSHTSLDPDGITFWHTGEYFGSNGAIRTRIYSFQLSTLAGIDAAQNAVSFAAYQNGNLLMVTGERFASKEKMVVDLFDINGRKISGKTINPNNDRIETSFDISKIAKGAYLVRIGNADFQKVVKVVVN
jgi:hypothetical protein